MALPAHGPGGPCTQSRMYLLENCNHIAKNGISEKLACCDSKGCCIWAAPALVALQLRIQQQIKDRIKDLNGRLQQTESKPLFGWRRRPKSKIFMGSQGKHRRLTWRGRDRYTSVSSQTQFKLIKTIWQEVNSKNETPEKISHKNKKKKWPKRHPLDTDKKTQTRHDSEEPRGGTNNGTEAENKVSKYYKTEVTHETDKARAGSQNLNKRLKKKHIYYSSNRN